MTRAGTKPRCGVCRFPMHKTLSGSFECRRAACGRPAKKLPVKRVKPRQARVIDKPRLEWAATQACCVTGRSSGGRNMRDVWASVHTHHVRTNGSPKDDTRIIRLLDSLHLAGYPYSIHTLGKRKFEEHWGISIKDEIAKLAARYEASLAQRRRPTPAGGKE